MEYDMGGPSIEWFDNKPPILGTMLVPLKDQDGFMQMLPVDDGKKGIACMMSVVYGYDKGKVNMDHIPKEDIIYISNETK